MLSLPSNNLRKQLDIDVIEDLGEGAYGIIKKIKIIESVPKYFPKDEYFALKITKKGVEQNEKEVQVIKLFNDLFNNCSNNLLCYFDISEDDDYYYLLGEIYDMDFFSLKFKLVNIKDKINKLNYIYPLFVDVIKGLSLLNELNLVHRDIKPENILFKEIKGKNYNKIKVAISDFSGLCSTISDIPSCDSLFFTTKFTDPVFIIKHLENDFIINDKPEYDMYALASSFYELLFLTSTMDYHTENVLNKLLNSDVSKIIPPIMKKTLIKDLKDLYIKNYENITLNIMDLTDLTIRKKVEDIDNMLMIINFNLMPFNENRDTALSALLKIKGKK
jgi:serine/threonine protein kinase